MQDVEKGERGKGRDTPRSWKGTGNGQGLLGSSNVFGRLSETERERRGAVLVREGWEEGVAICRWGVSAGRVAVVVGV